MRVFQCQHCAQVVFFENTRCESCGSALGFLVPDRKLSALATCDGAWIALAAPDRRFRYCANHRHGLCNWLVPDEDPRDLCEACALNRKVPDAADPNERAAWQQLEIAKHRLLYSVLRLGLPLRSGPQGAGHDLAFDFLREDPQGHGVRTGHAQGVITLALREADPVHRERLRREFGEPYRTLVGHFRHESGHYYWDRLIAPLPEQLASFRACFGDERRSYADALRAHYADGPSAGWEQRHVSAYAAVHPWEDWAETWAHYLHLTDALETAHALGLRLGAELPQPHALGLDANYDPYTEEDFDRTLQDSLPLTLAVNSLNRSMGQPDLYPFVLSPTVLDKLRFVHRVVRDAGGTCGTDA